MIKYWYTNFEFNIIRFHYDEANASLWVGFSMLFSHYSCRTNGIQIVFIEIITNLNFYARSCKGTSLSIKLLFVPLYNRATAHLQFSNVRYPNY